MQIIDNLLDLPAAPAATNNTTAERAAVILLDVQEKVNNHEATRLRNGEAFSLSDWRRDNATASRG